MDRGELERLVRENLCVFAKSEMDIKSTTRNFLEIETDNEKPIRQVPKRIPYGNARENASKQVKELLKEGLIRTCNSPYA